MTPSDDLQRLVERIEGATGPSIVLDREIALAVYPGAKPVAQTDARISVWDWNGRTQLTVKPYTASLDAAITLVREGWTHGYRWNEKHQNARALCEFIPEPPFAPHELLTAESRKCATPALAMASAALRARITQEQSNGMG